MRFICIAACWKKYGQVATRAGEDQPVVAEKNLFVFFLSGSLASWSSQLMKALSTFSQDPAAPAKPNRFDIKTFADKFG